MQNLGLLFGWRPRPNRIQKLSAGMHFKTQSLYELLIFTQCLFHSEALIVKAGLVAVDRWLAHTSCKWKYYSSPSKLVHIWRDRGRQVFSTWVTSFGALSAVASARGLPPKCVAGRWGSISNTEKKLLGCADGSNSDRLRQVCNVLTACIMHSSSNKVSVGHGCCSRRCSAPLAGEVALPLADAAAAAPREAPRHPQPRTEQSLLPASMIHGLRGRCNIDVAWGDGPPTFSIALIAHLLLPSFR